MEDALIDALQCGLEERMEQLEESFPPHVFSKRFVRRMRALTRQADRPRTLRLFVSGVKRAAVVMLTMAVLASATVLSVEALRLELFSLLEEVFATHTSLHFLPTSEPEDGIIVNPKFLPRVPKYIPEGFIVVMDIMDDCVVLEYEDDLGGNISYEQNYLYGTGMTLNTEGVQLEDITMHGCPGFYYSNVGMQSILWFDDYYVYSISSTLPREEVEKVAESVALKK